jgi:hypothetical protein
MKLSGDLAPCVKLTNTVFRTSAEDYIRWLKTKIERLPQVFVSVNENFISIVMEGLLAMAGGSRLFIWSLCGGLLLTAG